MAIQKTDLLYPCTRHHGCSHIDPLNSTIALTDREGKEHTWIRIETSTMKDGRVSFVRKRWGRDTISSDPTEVMELRVILACQDKALSYLDYASSKHLSNPTLLRPNSEREAGCVD